MKRKTSLHSITSLGGSMALAMLVFGGLACGFSTVPEPVPEPYYCEGQDEEIYCDEGEDCEYVCEPTEEIYCNVDNDCRSGQFCNLDGYVDDYVAIEDVAPEDCYEAEDGSSNCSGGARMRPEGRCETLPPPPPAGCNSDYDCATDEYCSFDGPYETQPAPDCGSNEDCGMAEPMPNGVCTPRTEPPPSGCSSDSECGPNAYCEIYEVCDAMPYPECEPGEDCPSQDVGCEVYSECTPYAPPPPPYGECDSDRDCEPNSYCNITEYCTEEAYPCDAEGGCSGEPVSPTCEVYSECVPYEPPPPYGECSTDSECDPNAYCEFYEECPDVLPADCPPNESCPDPYPYPYPCEVYGQCVSDVLPEPCRIDADCGPDARCLNEPTSGESVLSGMCIPVEVSDCEVQCLWNIDGALTECVNSGSNSQDECFAEAEVQWNNCVEEMCGELPPPPPPRECEDQCTEGFYRFIDECELSGAGPECIDEAQIFYEACQEECAQLPPPPTCEDTCLTGYDDVFWQCLDQGQAPSVCDQVATPVLNACLAQCGVPPTGECSRNADCGQGGTCQTIEWCESPACVDTNGDGVCDVPADGGVADASCGSESVCVYETEPTPDPGCTADEECEGGVCVIRTSCFFYCEIDDPDCCFEVGQCEEVAP